MKSFLTFTGTLIILTTIQSCSQDVITAKVRGTVVHEYIFSEVYNKYCPGATFLIMEKDTIYLFQSRTTNSDIIRNDKNLNKILGEANSYVVSDIDSLPQFDLKDTEHNYHKYIQHEWLVSSDQFYSNKLNSSIYSIYELQATIIIFSNNDYLIKKIQSAENVNDCACGDTMYSKLYNKRFATISKVEKTKKLLGHQVNLFNISPSSIKEIQLFYCE